MDCTLQEGWLYHLQYICVPNSLTHFLLIMEEHYFFSIKDNTMFIRVYCIYINNFVGLISPNKLVSLKDNVSCEAIISLLIQPWIVDTTSTSYRTLEVVYIYFVLGFSLTLHKHDLLLLLQYVVFPIFLYSCPQTSKLLHTR